jgi:hypothetical protein
VENGKWKMENGKWKITRFLELFRILDPKPQKSKVGRGYFLHRISFDYISSLHVLETL